jgi:hypothetical protein
MDNKERIIRDLQTTIGERHQKKRKKRSSSRLLGTNPRAKGTNPRAKQAALEKNKMNNGVRLIHEFEDFDWEKLYKC